MKCGGDSNDNCGGAGTISLYKECGSTCENVSYGVNMPPVDDPAVPLPTPATTAKSITSKAAVGAAPAASTKAAAGVVGAAPKLVVKAVDDNVEDVPPTEGEEDSSTTVKSTTTSSIFVNLPISTIASTKAAAGDAPAKTIKVSTIASTKAAAGDAPVKTIKISTIASAKAAAGVAPAKTIKAKCAGAETVTLRETIAVRTVTVTAGSEPSEVALPVVKNPASVQGSTGDKAAIGGGQGTGKPSTGNISRPEPVEEDDTQDNNPVDIAPVVSNPTTAIDSPPVIPSLYPTGNHVLFSNSTRPGRGNSRAKHGHGRHSSDVSSGVALPTGAGGEYVKY